MSLPEGEICVTRTGSDGGIEWSQQENIPLADSAGTEDTTPDWAAIRVALGVSSQTKAQNVAGYLLARALGIL